MYRNRNKFIVILTLAVLLLIAGAASARETFVGVNTEAAATTAGTAASIGTSFTYQGHLNDGGNPANGDYDFEFKLYNAASSGNQVGSTVSVEDVTVTGGLFNLQLDFGNVFDGTALWLEIGVRAGSSTGDYSTLTPRQALTPVPYALALPGVFPLNGNIGIGTISPNTMLHIDGTGIDNDGSTAVVRIVSGNGAQNLLLDGNEIDATADGLFLNNNTDQNVILANGGGNVGIGTTSPGAELDVNGDVIIRGDLEVQGDLTNFSVSPKFLRSSRDGNNPSPLLLMSASNSYCSLTKVMMVNQEDEDETTFCEVYRWEGSWWLKASTKGDANADCEARCLVW